MNHDGMYSSMPLNRLEHTPNVHWPNPVCSCMFNSLSLFLLGLLNGSWSGRFVLQFDMDLVEESMQMIGGLQSLARTQSSQYVLNEVSWVCNDAFWVSLAETFLNDEINTWFYWLFRHIEWKLLIPPEGLWRRGSRASNLKIVNMIVDFSQVKKEILKAAPLEVSQGDPHAGRPGVPIIFDLYF